MTVGGFRADRDAVVVGGGFYGLTLAASLASKGLSVLVVEAASEPMTRASAVNQARVHTGFHYPRSHVTALRSLHHHARFAEDYAPAVVGGFEMLYAVARHGTKVNARRFHGMFEAMGAPISRASATQRALFDADLVEDVFACRELAFDHTVLRRLTVDRLVGLPVELATGHRADRVEALSDGSLATLLSDGTRVRSERVFNVAYSGLNRFLVASGAAPVPLKHEFVEIALMDPPPELEGRAVTLMDGEFFSTMPWPAAGAYSLTHVRHTPRAAWTDADGSDAYAVAASLPRQSRWRHMVNDARRYVPAVGAMSWKRSIFDVKTVPTKNESDDGRPILLRRHPEIPGLVSVLGSKIDNVYDLLEAIG